MRIKLKFLRWDRLPGGDHVYGEPADSHVASAGRIDRSRKQPTITFDGFKTCGELREDGPEFLLEAEDVAAITRRLDPLRTAWLAREPPDWDSRALYQSRKERRWVEVTVGPHRFTGRPRDLRELRAAIRLLQKLGA